MIKAALEGKLDGVNFEEHPVFGLQMPTSCENIPADILNPRNTWEDKEAYDKKALELADSFRKNFSKFREQANEEILKGGPKAKS